MPLHYLVVINLGARPGRIALDADGSLSASRAIRSLSAASARRGCTSLGFSCAVRGDSSLESLWWPLRTTAGVSIDPHASSFNLTTLSTHIIAIRSHVYTLSLSFSGPWCLELATCASPRPQRLLFEPASLSLFFHSPQHSRIPQGSLSCSFSFPLSLSWPRGSGLVIRTPPGSVSLTFPWSSNAHATFDF